MCGIIVHGTTSITLATVKWSADIDFVWTPSRRDKRKLTVFSFRSTCNGTVDREWEEDCLCYEKTLIPPGWPQRKRTKKASEVGLSIGGSTSVSHHADDQSQTRKINRLSSSLILVLLFDHHSPHEIDFFGEEALFGSRFTASISFWKVHGWLLLTVFRYCPRRLKIYYYYCAYGFATGGRIDPSDTRNRVKDYRYWVEEVN